MNQEEARCLQSADTITVGTCDHPAMPEERYALLCTMPNRSECVIHSDGNEAFFHAFFQAPGAKYLFDAKAFLRAALECGALTEAAPELTEAIDFDVAIAGYLLDPARGERSLAQLVEDFLDAEQTALLQGFDPENAEANARAVFTLQQVLGQRLEADGMSQVFHEIDLPLCGVLSAMEFTGITVDQQALTAFGTSLGENITKLKSLITELAGVTFNLNSPKQLGEVLFETLKLPVIKKTKNSYSTDSDVLKKLESAHPVIRPIMEYRVFSKLQSTYVDGLRNLIGEVDQRIHTTFHAMTTATGRLSSSAPNLQNIPVRTELGSELRKMFIAPPGKLLIDADYSQIELRILAHIANDSVMLEAFRSGSDIHSVTAAKVFHLAPEAVTPELRRRAKAVNFGIIYGISAFALAEDLEISRNEAQEAIDEYLKTYSAIAEYRKEVVREARKNGYVSTLFGRRRYIPELQSKNFAVRSFGERIALNAPIQGTAADLMKLAMLHTHERFRENHLQSRLLLQIHDELIVESPQTEAEHAKQLLVEAMRSVAQLQLPLEVSVGIGSSWLDAK